jgi:hypothetical protein
VEAYFYPYATEKNSFEIMKEYEKDSLNSDMKKYSRRVLPAYYPERMTKVVGAIRMP